MRSVAVRYHSKFYRSFSRSIFVATLAASMLAGCGGGSHSALPDAKRNVSIAAYGSAPTQPPSFSVHSNGGITEYSLPNVNPSANPYPARITAGPDGNLWFTEVHKIAKITTRGTITEYPLLTADAHPLSIAAGPDGNLWFTDSDADKIGKITAQGKVTEYPAIPTEGAFSIAAGRDRNLWFTELGIIGKIDTHGKITEYPIPSAPFMSDIAAGPDGNIWFTESTSGKIGKITSGGKITEYSMPTRSAQPLEIAAGPDGNLWFTETVKGLSCGEFPCPVLAYNIGKITTAGRVTEYPLPLSGRGATGIAAGPDGNLWFTEAYSNEIGKITAAGKITEYPVPTSIAIPLGIIVGPDRNLWFTEYNSDKIGKIDPARP
jgi:streptogramin lyase